MIKKIKIISIFLFCLFSSISAQVGINTLSPSGIYHIHTGSTTNTDNDVVISSNGYMGIHTISPQAKLHLKGTLRVSGIPDIPSGNKYLIASEADGTFTTIVPGNIPWIQGNIPSNLTSLPSLPVSGASVSYTTINISLPKGKWIVYLNATHSIDGTAYTSAVAEGAFIKWEMVNAATGNTDNIIADFSTVGYVNSYLSTGCIFLVDNYTSNTTNATKTYYFRGSATTQNTLSFAYTANLWAEFYTTP